MKVKTEIRFNQPIHSIFVEQTFDILERLIIYLINFSTKDPCLLTGLLFKWTNF